MTIPPGRTTTVAAHRVLVIAPHYDDEVLGCGGLLLQLVARGAEARVLFLSDGGGGEEDVPDRGAYARRRRLESERSLAWLGASGRRDLDLPDGRLREHVGDIAQAIREEITGIHPDLLLAPAATEVSADHVATFDALVRALSPVRRGPGLQRALDELRILLYEVNHPGHPDVLIDVGAELPRFRQLMAAYESQEARHGYLRAALGLRAFRTLTLGPDVEAAEGYRRLEIEPPAAAVDAGASDRPAGPATVSVIVRTRDRPRLLAEALASLARGSHRDVELVLVNDGGRPPELAAGFPFPIARVDLDPARGRGGAAQAGLEAASGAWVAFLDDDDLYRPHHLATLLRSARDGGRACVYADAVSGFYEADGAGGWTRTDERLVYHRDFDRDLLLLDNYIPLITVLAQREAAVAAGGFDPELEIFEDWDFLIRLSERTPLCRVPEVTCEYRHFRSGHDHAVSGPAVRPAALLEARARVFRRHAALLDPATLARGVHLLARELGEAREDLERLERERVSGATGLDRLGREAARRLRRWWRSRRAGRPGE